MNSRSMPFASHAQPPVSMSSPAGMEPFGHGADSAFHQFRRSVEPAGSHSQPQPPHGHSHSGHSQWPAETVFNQGDYFKREHINYTSMRSINDFVMLVDSPAGSMRHVPCALCFVFSVCLVATLLCALCNVHCVQMDTLCNEYGASRHGCLVNRPLPPQSPVLAQYEGSWYRATVIVDRGTGRQVDTGNPGGIDVYFIDYGNRHTIIEGSVSAGVVPPPPVGHELWSMRRTCITCQLNKHLVEAAHVAPSRLLEHMQSVLSASCTMSIVDVSTVLGAPVHAIDIYDGGSGEWLSSALKRLNMIEVHTATPAVDGNVSQLALGTPAHTSTAHNANANGHSAPVAMARPPAASVDALALAKLDLSPLSGNKWADVRIVHYCGESGVWSVVLDDWWEELCQVAATLRQDTVGIEAECTVGTLAAVDADGDGRLARAVLVHCDQRTHCSKVLLIDRGVYMTLSSGSGQLLRVCTESACRTLPPLCISVTAAGGGHNAHNTAAAVHNAEPLWRHNALARLRLTAPVSPSATVAVCAELLVQCCDRTRAQRIDTPVGNVLAGTALYTPAAGDTGAAAPHTANATVALDRSYSHTNYTVTSRPRVSAANACYNCGQTGHFARECVVGVVCNSCGQGGHKAFQCPDRH